jgi:hypothetical protein
MRRILTFVSALCIAAFSLPATAAVVYNWVELEGNPLLGGPIVGRIVVKDDFWKRGSASFFFLAGELMPASTLGLSDFFFDSPRMSSISLALAPCSEIVPGDPDVGTCASNGFPPDELMVSGPTTFSFDLHFGALLSGSFAASTGLDHAGFIPASGSQIISIGRAYNEDTASHPCSLHFTDFCPTRGVWLLDRTTVPISEPSTVFALLAGLVPLLSLRLRRCL